MKPSCAPAPLHIPPNSTTFATLLELWGVAKIKPAPRDPDQTHRMTNANKSMGWPGKGGSGPVAGVIGITDTTSVAALKNYYPKGGVEFVYDPTTNRLAAGKPKYHKLPSGSEHELLAYSINADSQTVVGGTLNRGAQGEFLTSEQSGHYKDNWSLSVSRQFQHWLQMRTGLRVVHYRWSKT